jgi:hypothetical protein
MCDAGRGIAIRAARSYVQARITSSRVRRDPRSPQTPSEDSPNHPTHFRYFPPPDTQDLALALEVPDFELWAKELSHDFLIEPTPYLVASAICYVGGVLILVQYYWALWWLVCYSFRLLPWDDDLGFA